MNTLGIRACTGTGGGNTYLTGCITVDVDIALQSIAVGPQELQVDVTIPSYSVDVDNQLQDVDVLPETITEDTGIQVIIKQVGIDNGCSSNNN